MSPPAERTINYGAYGDWRTDSLSKSWSAFSDSDVQDKDVLDFGCGDGALSFYLGQQKRPKRPPKRKHPALLDNVKKGISLFNSYRNFTL